MKTIIFLSLILFFQMQTSIASPNECFGFYQDYKYSLANFKSELREKNKFTDDYRQKSDVLVGLLSSHTSKMVPAEYLKVSLYIINRATNFINDYGVYSEGVVRVATKIVENSRRVPLSFEQAEALRTAIADRPGFLWRDSSDIAKMIDLSKQPIGSSGHLPIPELLMSPTVRNVKAEIAKNWKLTRDLNDQNDVIGSVLLAYAPRMSSEDFTTISVWLVRWKLRYGAHYWGMNGEYIVKGYEKIRKASLLVNLTPEQIDKIKSTMKNQSRSIPELLHAFPVGAIASLQGWSDRSHLGALLGRPFGKQD